MKNKKQQNRVLKSIAKIVVPILKRNGVVKAGIFGSYARGDQKKNSDVDILIKIKRKKFSLLDLAGLQIELEEKLGKKVDLLSYSSIHPYIKRYIKTDEIRII